MRQLGVGYVELWQGHLNSVPLRDIRQVKQKFEDAGIVVYALNYSFRDDFTDKEITRGFDIAKALGTDRMTASSTVTMARRLAKYAERARVYVGMHNHSNIQPNEFVEPADFEEAMSAGRYIGVNLDLGHFTASGYDPVEFVSRYHSRIVTVRVRDRKKSDGPNVPFGEGDTPIGEVLRLIKSNRFDIPAMIEYEYKGNDTLTEVRRCLEYCKRALA
jgi:sugar phosphate isomerase/epimerase